MNSDFLKNCNEQGVDAQIYHLFEWNKFSDCCLVHHIVKVKYFYYRK